MSAPKLIGNDKQFRQAALKALDVLSSCVSSTMGPDGASILIDRGPDYPPISTKDGVTVALNISLKDPVLNTFVRAIKEGAERTVATAGDGTTATILLTNAFVVESLKFVRAGQISAQKLALQLKNLEGQIIEKLDSMKRDIKTEEEILNVAMISANGDAEVAEKVVEAVDSAGRDGVISIEECDSQDISVVRIEGFKLDTGWGKHEAYGSLFVTDPGRQEVVLENCDVLLYDGNLQDYNELAIGLVALAEKRGKGGALKPTAIVAHNFGGQVRDLISQQVAKLRLPITLIQTRMAGTVGSQLQWLDDLSVLLKCKIIRHGDMGNISNPVGIALDEYVGKCGKIVQTRNSTTFFGGAGTSEEIQSHVSVIKRQMADFESEFDRSLYRARIGRLVNGIVVVKCGGQSDLAMKERKDRVEDAINATRAAILEGILPGGGTALLAISKTLKSQGSALGREVFSRALQYPCRQIAENSGESPDVVVDTIVRMHSLDTPNPGFDARNLVYVDDLFAAGIIDPLRVVKTAFLNALSIAIEILKGGGYSVIAGATQSIKREAIEPDYNMPGENPDDFLE